MTSDITFEEFYKQIGFVEYPFASGLPSRSETAKRSFLLDQVIMGRFMENFRSGSGMFLVGERGTGKTAAIYDLLRSAESANLVIHVEDFSGVAVAYEPRELYYLIISNVADRIFKKLLADFV